jgi:myosin heavy subunit
VALSTLLRSALHGSDENAPSLLVLDVPGQEAELLGSLGDELRNVSAVIVRRCARPLPDAQPWSSVLERMRDQAFERVGQEPDGEPLWPVACFRLDRRRHEVVALRREVESLRAQLADAASALDSANGAAEQLRLGQDRQVEALAAEKAASDALATDLAARLEASVRSLSHAEALAKAEAQAAAQKAAAEHAASLRNATQALDEQVALFAEQRKLHEQAQAQFAAADKRRTELDAALTAARKRVQALEADLRQTQGSLHLAIRSRSVAESDLRDLQERYGSLMGERQATRELLTRILDRLEAVREHHARLSESATGDAEGAGVAATTSPASRSVAAGAGKAPPSGAGRGQR